MAQTSWALVSRYVFKHSKFNTNFKNKDKRNNVLYVVFLCRFIKNLSYFPNKRT